MAAGGFGLTDGSLASAGFGVVAWWVCGCCCAAVTDCNVDAERRNAAVAEELSFPSVALGDNAGGGLCGGDTAGFVSVLELLP